MGDDRARLLSYVEESAAGCWNWGGPRDREGYGRAFLRGTRTTAHRAMYRVFNGDVPSDVAIDHVCRNRACVNPGHLRPLSWAQNCSDNGQARRTHCPHGHAYTDSNTAVRETPRGHRQRVCRTCRKMYADAHKDDKKAYDARRNNRAPRS